MLKIKIELKDKKKIQVIQGRPSDCPELKVISGVTAWQLPTSATPDMARGSLFGETLSCLPPLLIGSHCFHTPATFPPWGCVRWCWGWVPRELSCALCLLWAPLPTPGVQASLPGTRCQARGTGCQEREKTILKYLSAHPFRKFRIMWLSRTYEINLPTSPRGGHQPLAWALWMTGNSMLQRDTVKGWGQSKGHIRVFGAYRLLHEPFFMLILVKALWVPKNPLVLKVQWRDTGEVQRKDTALSGNRTCPVPISASLSRCLLYPPTSLCILPSSAYCLAHTWPQCLPPLPSLHDFQIQLPTAHCLSPLIY